MFARFLGAGVAALVAVSLMGIGMMMRWDAQQVAPPDRATSTLARTLTQDAREGPTATGDWAIIRANSAHDMLVVEIEAERFEEARRIAAQLIEPIKTRGYVEILVYIRQPGRKEPAVRRVQWTPRGGYVESTYVDR